MYLPAACASMHVYCVRVLGMAEEVAYKRIRAARAARAFPVVLDAVAEGRLDLTGVVLIAPHLKDENAAELVAEVDGKSKAEIEVVLARRAPKPDVRPKLEREHAQAELDPGRSRSSCEGAGITRAREAARARAVCPAGHAER